MKIVTIFSFLLLWGCGASPLFNHKSELKSVVNDSTRRDSMLSLILLIVASPV